MDKESQNKDQLAGGTSEKKRAARAARKPTRKRDYCLYDNPDRFLYSNPTYAEWNGQYIPGKNWIDVFRAAMTLIASDPQYRDKIIELAKTEGSGLSTSGDDANLVIKYDDICIYTAFHEKLDNVVRQMRKLFAGCGLKLDSISFWEKMVRPRD